MSKRTSEQHGSYGTSDEDPPPYTLPATQTFPPVTGWYMRHGVVYPSFGWGIYHGRRAYKAGNIAVCGPIMIGLGLFLLTVGIVLTPLVFTVLAEMKTNTTFYRKYDKSKKIHHTSVGEEAMPWAITLLMMGVLLLTSGVFFHLYVKKKMAAAQLQFRDHPELFSHYQAAPDEQDIVLETEGQKDRMSIQLATVYTRHSM